MKFYGKVGFWIEDVETSPGVYQSKIIEKTYFGDITRNDRRWQERQQQNDEMKVNNSVSILSDIFAQRNYTSIKYVILNGIKLKVNSVTLDYPRIKLEIGGEYNGENSANSS